MWVPKRIMGPRPCAFFAYWNIHSDTHGFPYFAPDKTSWGRQRYPSCFSDQETEAREVEWLVEI